MSDHDAPERVPAASSTVFQDRRLAALFILQALVLVAFLKWLALYPPEPERWNLFIILVAAALTLGTLKVKLKGFQTQITPTFALECVALLSCGPAACTVVACAGALTGSLFSPRKQGLGVRWNPPPWDRSLFNLINVATAATVAGFAYVRVTGAPVLDSAIPLIIQASGLIGFTLVEFAANSIPISMAISIQRGASWWTVWRFECGWTILSYLGSAGIAHGVVLLINEFGLAIMAPVAPVLALLIYHYRLGGEKLELVRSQAEIEQRHLRQINDMNIAVIGSLAAAIDARDQHTASHINRVRVFALALAGAAGVDEVTRQAVETGALVHDIGKLGIPDHILLKPGKLSPDEMVRMQSHVHIGAEILSPVNFPFPVVEVVLSHHERWDGQGYPEGRAGSDIPVGGRIIAIVDAFDAVTSDRPYRRALPIEEGVNFLREGAGRKYDPELVAKFIEVLPRALEEIKAEELATSEKRSPQIGDHGSALRQIAETAAETAEHQALAHLEHELAGADGTANVLRSAVLMAKSLLPVDTSGLYLIDEDRTNLTLAYVEGKEAERLRGMTMSVSEGVAGRVAESNQALVNVSSAQDIARRFGPHENIELSLATVVPIRAGDSVTGCLAVYTERYLELREHHVRILGQIADRIAAALTPSPTRGRAGRATSPLRPDDPIVEDARRLLACSRSGRIAGARALVLMGERTDRMDGSGGSAEEEVEALAASLLREEAFREKMLRSDGVVLLVLTAGDAVELDLALQRLEQWIRSGGWSHVATATAVDSNGGCSDDDLTREAIWKLERGLLLRRLQSG